MRVLCITCKISSDLERIRWYVDMHRNQLFSVLLTWVCVSQTGAFDTAVSRHKAECLAEGAPGMCGGLLNVLLATGVPSLRRYCCGYCTCESSCYTYGTCCLQMYANFSHAQTVVEKARLRCIQPEFIGSRPYAYVSPPSVWMIGKCSHGGHDKITMSQCENPEPDNTFRSLVPVTDYTTDVSYRNIFCAVCNNQTSRYLESWGMELKCDVPLQMPEKDILGKMVEHNCSFSFLQPSDNTKLCYIPPYTVSVCNQTGLWPKYEEIVDQACKAFIDPFNQTYKNYFCYLCNIDSPEYSIDTCKSPVVIASRDQTPSFKTFLYINMIEKWQNNELLDCDTTRQFEDYYLMKCRTLHCHDSRYLSNGECFLKENSSNSPCYSASLRIFPPEGRPFPPVNRSALLDIVTVLLTYFRDISEIMQHQAWFAKYDDETGVVDAIIAHFLLNNIDALKFLIQVTETGNRVFGENIGLYYVALKAELTEFNFDIFSDGIRNISGLKIDGLETIYTRKLGDGICLQKGNVAFTKLKICPFVKLDGGEIGEETLEQNKSLLIRKIQTTLSSWKYERHTDQIYICLDDYIRIYRKLQARNIGRETSRRNIQTKNVIDTKHLLIDLSVFILVVTIIT